jgi:hypothetical protein
MPHILLTAWDDAVLPAVPQVEQAPVVLENLAWPRSQRRCIRAFRSKLPRR